MAAAARALTSTRNTAWNGPEEIAAALAAVPK